MVDPALMLGAAVVKTACKIWLKDHAIAADAAVGVVDIIQARVSEERERRRLQRMFAVLEERVADNVLRNPEFDRVPENERAAAVQAVADTFNEAKLDHRGLFATDLDPSRLYRVVRRAGWEFANSLSWGATELYDQILRICCAQVIEVANALPGFEVGVFGEILSRQTEIMRHIDRRFDQLPTQVGGAGAETFEPAYLRLVANQLDKVELFGVSVNDRVGTYPLSVAYVSLTICSTEERAYDVTTGSIYELSQEMAKPERQVTSIEDALSTTRRAYIRGEAGSGKTTLLQWLAVRCGHRDFDGPMRDWNGCVPVFIRLRRYSGLALPRPENFLHEVGGSIAQNMPPNWMRDVLESGRALVLVDGVDELPESQRRRARQWLRELLLAYPNARYVVTSRPTATTESWLDDAAFEVLEIQPMTMADIKALVSHWHAALAEGVTAAAEVEHIETLRQELTQKIRTHRHLRMLTVNPLMTALICALHADRRMRLPHDRMELYSVALEMLLERRDTEREIQTPDIGMSRVDKILILQDLAYWLVLNGWSNASRDRVLARLKVKLSELHRVQAKPEEVLKHLLDRSGLLRMPVEGQIDFVHKTFQEFLAGRAVVAADDIGVLIKNAHDDQWREVVLMAVAHGRREQTDELLRGILDRAEREPDRQYVLQVLAVGCIQHAPQLSPELQRVLQEVAADLLPPKDINHAMALAGAGDLVLELLLGRTHYTATEAAATIRMAATVGGDHAMLIIANCASISHPLVKTELRHAWSKFDPEEYVRQVFTRANIYSLDLEDPGLLPALKHFPIRHLRCGFKHGYGNVKYVGDLPHLKSFSLLDPSLESLKPLGEHTNLKALILSEGTGAVDISPLGGCQSLSEFGLAFSSIADVRQLRALAQIGVLYFFDRMPLSIVLANLSYDLRLRDFGIGPTVSTVRNLDELIAAPQLSKLDSLDLSGADSLESIAGIERWAESMADVVLNARRLSDIENLSNLKRLRSADLFHTPIGSLDFLDGSSQLVELVIGGRDVSIPDLAPLAGLTSLARLRLWSEKPVDVSGLAGASHLDITILSPKRVIVHGEQKLSDTVSVQHELVPSRR